MNDPHPDFDSLAPPRDQQFLSMGYAGQILQVMPAQLKVLMLECNVRFAKVVDGVGYLLVEDAETLAAKCRDIRKEMHDVSQSAKYN